ncbi:hypothetical protein POM88_054371 [Heracleum sosnowskyi]|uniref:ACT domain-containing protein ACR n=1 Tax=Heracleum sosnowskyi TaxID=360622 RepID=A0AAD8GMV9_9APIA|nr:hypothetical protein POM88_054371 [Heracleum sosnowskyi]
MNSEEEEAALILCSMKNSKVDSTTSLQLEETRVSILKKHKLQHPSSLSPLSNNTRLLSLVPPSLAEVIGDCSTPFDKRLTGSDIQENQVRLLLKYRHVMQFLNPLLRPSEIYKIKKSGLTVCVYDSNGKMYEMVFSLWGTKAYVITTRNWFQFCVDHGFQTLLDWVTVWMFRHTLTGRICFVITSERRIFSKAIEPVFHLPAAARKKRSKGCSRSSNLKRRRLNDDGETGGGPLSWQKETYTSFSKDMDDEYEKLFRRINPPRVVIDNESCNHATVIQVDTYISSDGGWFMDVFNVTDQDGNEITEVDILDYIYKALRPDSSNFGYSIRRSVGVKSAMVHIVIELIRFDKPGLLSELCALLNLKCNVLHAEETGEPLSWQKGTYISFSQDMDDEYEKLIRRMNPPRVVIDNESCKHATVIQVCLFLVLFVYPFVINGVLTDLNLTISKAYISSDGGWFVNVFNVTDQDGNEITEVDALGPDSNSRYSIRRSVGVKSALVNTAIELIRSDKPRLLSELSALLTHLKCNVVSAEMWTHNTRAAAMVQVTNEETGGAITDSERLSVIKQLCVMFLMVATSQGKLRL